MEQITPGILRIDLHGKNVYQARVTIDAALRRSTGAVYRLRIIHGYHQGTALRDFIRKEYTASPRVLRIVPLGDAATDLVLREI